MLLYMGKQTFKYIFTCIGIYLSLFIIEIILFKPLVEFVGDSFKVLVIAYNLFLFILNPLVLWSIIKKINFKSNDIIE